jgi:hypothetical protein
MNNTGGDSLFGAVWAAIITARVAVLIFCAVLLFFLRFPLALLVILVLGLAYSLYRIGKDWKASRLAKEQRRQGLTAGAMVPDRQSERNGQPQ